jgi:hypothetical protein
MLKLDMLQKREGYCSRSVVLCAVTDGAPPPFDRLGRVVFESKNRVVKNIIIYSPEFSMMH